MALLALLGVFVASYLALHNLGYIGTLACTAGNPCETVQASHYARFLGVYVAIWGVAYYVAVFAITLAGVFETFADSRWLAGAVALLTGWGLAFSGYLTYRELFTIHAICWWCVGSAVIAVSLFALAAIDWAAVRGDGLRPRV
ncbi:MAG TPA: vitamin K epoxide reductase family protein [Gemmatimonadaceae bacterium]|nr:vitamin K epoxide reductase family protein [Gemmatimonadaceae bacterium]